MQNLIKSNNEFAFKLIRNLEITDVTLFLWFLIDSKNHILLFSLVFIFFVRKKKVKDLAW